MKKKTMIIIAAVVVLILGGWRGYRSIVPSGASFTPFLIARTRGPVVSSPDGSKKLQAWFNDAGAAHSGNHWTWIVKDHLLFGKKVVAQGYLGAEQAVSGDPLPLCWLDNSSFAVTFLSERYGDTQNKAIVKLQ